MKLQNVEGSGDVVCLVCGVLSHNVCCVFAMFCCVMYVLFYVSVCSCVYIIRDCLSYVSLCFIIIDCVVCVSILLLNGCDSCCWEKWGRGVVALCCGCVLCACIYYDYVCLHYLYMVNLFDFIIVIINCDNLCVLRCVYI